MASTPIIEKPVPTPARPPVARKFNSPFSWLSRATTGTDKKPASPPATSPPPHDRRNTTSTVGSNSELMLSKLDEGDEPGSATKSRHSQSSLKDRFKIVRMREEAGISAFDEGSVPEATNGGVFGNFMGRSASVASPTSPSIAEKDESFAPTMKHSASSPGPSPITRKPTINPNLPPGTVSGMSTAPDADAEVDWDLWQAVVNEGPAAVARSSPEQLNRAIAGGIPQAIRGVIWQVLAMSKNEDLEAIYPQLVARGSDKPNINGNTADGNSSSNRSSKGKESLASSASSIHSDNSTPPMADGATSPSLETLAVTSRLAALKARPDPTSEQLAKLHKLEKAIKRDLGTRTSYSKYIMAAGLQDGLYGVCKAYALYDEEVGYAQGMNFIVMPLLFNMPEEEAFCMLVRIMYQYGLRQMFIQDMPGLHLHLYQFSRLLEDLEPALYCHLHRRGVSPNLYATQWFLTLFAYRFPLQLVLRIYDLILSEGLEGAILKFGIVLMQKNRETLLGMKDMSALTNFLKDRLFDVYIDKAPSASSILDSGFFGSALNGVDREVYRADMLVQDACSVKITPEMLASYAAEWEEQQRAESQRQNELQILKSQCTSLQSQVRRLEEAAEQSDTEHVQVASELVRIKVENEELQDQNESLKGQVEELKNVVAHQTEEVEARLRAEMDAVMQRNIEVHNLNRAVEEEKQEMERALVDTKLRLAQINSEYEAIKQKWASITQMLNS
ncbi:RabGAP/TBC [Trichodelitschia bisporula]|uniref:GTPase-activating protein GYP5 n=1 Tax=Trichodelitschia bisporula TaxID=703511 RepID=A0A6G1I9J7_9PEZI|nr:RabGAP/TBC [Trichodelitschia bisporula]